MSFNKNLLCVLVFLFHVNYSSGFLIQYIPPLCKCCNETVDGSNFEVNLSRSPATNKDIPEKDYLTNVKVEIFQMILEFLDVSSMRHMHKVNYKGLTEVHAYYQTQLNNTFLLDTWSDLIPDSNDADFKQPRPWYIFLPDQLRRNFQCLLGDQDPFYRGNFICPLNRSGEVLFITLNRYDVLFTALNLWTQENFLSILLEKLSTMYDEYHSASWYLCKDHILSYNSGSCMRTYNSAQKLFTYQQISVNWFHFLQNSPIAESTSFLIDIPVDFPLFFLVYVPEVQTPFLFCTMNYTVEKIYRRIYSNQEWFIFVFQAGRIQWNYATNEAKVWIPGAPEKIADGIYTIVQPFFYLDSTKFRIWNAK